MTLFNFSSEFEADSQSVNWLLYDSNLNEVESICYFRKLQAKYAILVDKTKPLVIANYLNHVSSFDFVNESKFV